MKSVALLLALLASPAWATGLHLEATEEPPEKSAPVVWHFQELEVQGLWVTEAQSRRIAAELDLCREEASSMQRALVPWWMWATAGVLLGGAAVWVAKK